MYDNGVKEFPDPDASGDSSIGPRLAARILEEGSLRFKHGRSSILARHHARGPRRLSTSTKMKPLDRRGQGGRKRGFPPNPDQICLMRLLVVVAHPDDKSFGCGSVLAHAAANRYDAAVVYATLGEAGESRIETDDLAALRESELRAAAAILGIGLVRLLGHVDSGITGEPPPGALVSVDPALLAAEVQAVIEELRPDVVVTLDASDGHRDHVDVRDATLTAVDASAHPAAAIYLWCPARSSMTRRADNMGTNGRGDAYLAITELGTPDADITLVIDVEEHLATRCAAIRAHRSQASPTTTCPRSSSTSSSPRTVSAASAAWRTCCHTVRG